MPNPTPASPDPIAVDIIEAARLLSLSEGSLRARTQEGAVPHLRIGGRLLYSVDALRAWALEQAMSNITPTKNETAPTGRITKVDQAGAEIATGLAQLERRINERI